MTIRVVLIDNDPAALSVVRGRLSGRDDFKVIGDASCASDALTKVAALQPDAVFVDIEMMESSNLDIAQLLCLPVRPVIVFFTACTHYAVKAFDLGAADYLVKPASEDRFAMSLNRIRKHLVLRSHKPRQTAAKTESQDRNCPGQYDSSERITVNDGRRTHIIQARDIEWIGAAGDYTELHVGGATHLLREPLSVLLGRLPEHLFCRIHRSFVVNLSRVSGFKTLRNQDLLLRLKDRTVLRASRTFSDELRRMLPQRCA